MQSGGGSSSWNSCAGIKTKQSAAKRYEREAKLSMTWLTPTCPPEYTQPETISGGSCRRMLGIHDESTGITWSRYNFSLICIEYWVSISGEGAGNGTLGKLRGPCVLNTLSINSPDERNYYLFSERIPRLGRKLWRVYPCPATKGNG